MSGIIGQMRSRVTLQARTRSDEDGGSANVTWTDVATMFAQVRPVSGRQIVSAEGITARVTHEVRLRYNAAIQPLMHFTFGSRILRIHDVIDEDGRRRWLICHCEERLP